MGEWKEDLEKIPSQQYSNIYEEISQKTQRLGMIFNCHEMLEQYKKLEEQPVNDFRLNEIPNSNKHTFVILKDSLKREINDNGRLFYPMSREMKHVLKLHGGNINIKIQPRRKYDQESREERKCVRVKVESENVKHAKGFIQIHNQKQKNDKFIRFKMTLDNIGEPVKQTIFYHQIKSNNFIEKTKNGEDFFHLSVVITQFGDRPSPELSMSDLLAATREVKKEAKGYFLELKAKAKVQQFKRTQNTMPSRLPKKEFPNLPSLVPSRASRLAASKKKHSNSSELIAINNFAEGDTGINSKVQADLQKIADDTDTEDELSELISDCILDDASIHSHSAY